MTTETFGENFEKIDRCRMKIVAIDFHRRNENRINVIFVDSGNVRNLIENRSSIRREIFSSHRKNVKTKQTFLKCSFGSSFPKRFYWLSAKDHVDDGRTSLELRSELDNGLSPTVGNTEIQQDSKFCFRASIKTRSSNKIPKIQKWRRLSRSFLFLVLKFSRESQTKFSWQRFEYFWQDSSSFGIKNIFIRGKFVLFSWKLFNSTNRCQTRMIFHHETRWKTVFDNCNVARILKVTISISVFDIQFYRWRNHQRVNGILLHNDKRKLF